ncbi:hypothetical protein [Pectobacterium aroidearum]|uniref:Uncharacterized protein n=1 Tax=Pectobacterium aroidearum TaxID=1201031 RepID=A0AAW3SP20_9GAMM|nr:hypothetical protein [Pectobacterium aroidearum]MBA5202210.1 hypothetical protein [Pectobacterium aroidearum]MBA5601032.1 hypothetical protein [Pectobacterium aroidearum]MDY4387875.1 hypothetical protein [Pectobacterium aroidearum]
MAKKHPGICPHCREKVTPDIIEENSIRRDKCKCPKCEGVVYVCRTPGCDDYAKGGNTYDEELCPQCTKVVADNTGTILKGVAAIAVPVITKAAIDTINPTKN